MPTRTRATPQSAAKIAQRAATPSAAAHPLLALQRTAGNAAVVAALRLQRQKGGLPPGAITSGKLGKLGTERETVFRKTVYDEQLAWALANKKEYFAGPDPKELASFEGQQLHKDAIPDATALLITARVTLLLEQAQKIPRALRCGSIGVASAYRDPVHDFRAWQDAYSTVFKRTQEARDQLDDPLGSAAVGIMVRDLVGSKALPGFSNHTRGLAIDFSTTQNGKNLGPRKAQREAWRKSWLYQWLHKHGADFNFSQLKTEEWHWDHSKAPSGGGGAAPATAPANAPAATPAAAAPAAGPASASAPPTTQPAAAATTDVSITFGKNARQDAVASTSLDVARDILRAANIRSATISSTARTPEDQARAMYDNLVTQGVAKQHALYGPAGDAVVDKFVELREKKLSPTQIKEGMRDLINEVGPARISRHCGDPAKLNVLDISPASLGGAAAQKAFVAAVAAEVGKRVSKYIPYPKDPGHHLEIPSG